MDVRLGPGARLTVAVAALAVTLALAGPAGAASPIGPDGAIHGCYVAKGKKKGQLRLLPPGKSCKRKKKERPIVWSVQGPAGTAGAQGPQGAQGPAGQSGISTDQLTALTERINQQDATIASLNATINGLTTTINGLLTQVGTLQGVLAGLTNTELTGVVAKLNGISGAELNSTVDGLAALTAVCTQVSDLTTFGNDLRTAVSGIGLSGTIPVGLTLAIPSLPAALAGFACPAF